MGGVNYIYIYPIIHFVWYTEHFTFENTPESPLGVYVQVTEHVKPNKKKIPVDRPHPLPFLKPLPFFFSIFYFVKHHEKKRNHSRIGRKMGSKRSTVLKKYPRLPVQQMGLPHCPDAN